MIASFPVAKVPGGHPDHDGRDKAQGVSGMPVSTRHAMALVCPGPKLGHCTKKKKKTLQMFHVNRFDQTMG
jgi:hypothetical protein